MSKEKTKSSERSDLIIDGSVSTWLMRIEGDINGTYSGAFKFRCYLDPLQQIAANREYRELLGPNPTFASEHESFLAYALTQLKYRILSAPPFWASSSSSGIDGNIADENVISAILDAALGSEIKFKSILNKRKAEAIKRGKKAAEALMSDKEDDENENEEEDEE